MKIRISILIFLSFCVCLFPLFGAEKALLAEASGQITPEKAVIHSVQKFNRDGEIFVSVNDSTDKKIWESESLGTEDKNFIIDELSQTLAIKDVTGDGIKEIITAAFFGPRASGLYIFTFDSKANSFVPIKCTFPNENLTRDLIVSDILLEDGSDIVFLKDSKVRVMGLIYPEDPNGTIASAYFYFDYSNGEYVLSSQEKLPPDTEK